jgi:hypothetical protein
MKKRHLILIDSELKGREYGTLNAFNEAIIKITSGDTLILPKKTKFENRFFQSSNFRCLRKFSRKTNLKNITENKYDVVWYICMGPENYRFDLMYGIENIKNRVIYFFDTLPHQFSLIKKLKISRSFNIQISSFDDAINILERMANSKWHFIQQASSLEYFPKKSIAEKEIAFASFGRGNLMLNDIIQEFCDSHGLIFDRTHETSGQILTNNELLYKSYCRSLSNAVFNICFSVEHTDPNRSGVLSPITCRWYESFLARNIVLGIQPKNSLFNQIFPKNFVYELNEKDTKENILLRLEELWENREALYSQLYENSNYDVRNYDWDNRIIEILELTD